MDKNIELETAPCDLCGGADNKIVYCMPDLRFRHYKPEYSVVECLGCGHRFLSPRPTVKDITLFYPKNYYAGRDVSDPRQQKRYLRQTGYLPEIAGCRVLDVGCAGGQWLSVVKDRGWECYGIDFIESPCKAQGVNIRYGYLPDVYNRYYQASFFDVVCAWGVMEHVHEPSKFFQCINWLLKDAGIFIFLVPNGDSLWSRWAYKEDIPRHLHFFRAKTLRLYAEKYGYKISRIDYTNNIYSIPATGRGLFRRRLLRMAGASWDDILNSPHNIFLKLLGRAGSLLDYSLIHPKLEKFFHLCGNMVVVFEKIEKCS